MGVHFVFALEIKQILQRQKTQVILGAISRAHALKTKKQRPQYSSNSGYRNENSKQARSSSEPMIISATVSGESLMKK